VNVAIPPADIVPVPSTVAPSRNVTVSPVGAPDDPATVAVSVTSWPALAGLGAAVSVVVVVCCIATLTADEALPRKLGSPA